MENTNNNIEKKKRGRKPLIQVFEFNLPSEYRNPIKTHTAIYQIPIRIPEP